MRIIAGILIGEVIAEGFAIKQIFRLQIAGDEELPEQVVGGGGLEAELGIGRLLHQGDAFLAGVASVLIVEAFHRAVDLLEVKGDRGLALLHFGGFRVFRIRA